MQEGYIPVLDHGWVGLVEHMGSDLSVVRNARVSNDLDKKVFDEDRDRKLIHYLMKNRHTSPFEAVVFNFEIKCPMFIARQWHRHRTWAYNEVSARYTELPSEYYIPNVGQVGVQSKSNKQARDISESIKEAEELLVRMDAHNKISFELYGILLDNAMPRELARSVLPVSAYTRFFGCVNLHNLFHFLRLRLHPHAQWEIQQYAEGLLSLIEPIVPVSVEAFKVNL